ncbi:MAG: hypothetical protein QGH94_14160 [Phycisphaerae bacterium]|jgi:hypothetical protein|nr:hypothetical protein [Phycisphaerae bacterium]MDP7289126.1 hypothetical protein [Phycisphaerae bacterium]
MAEAVITDLYIRRWLMFIWTAFVVQSICTFLIAPQFVCACSRREWEVAVVLSIPVLWELGLLATCRGWAERCATYTCMAVSVAIILLFSFG